MVARAATVALSFHFLGADYKASSADSPAQDRFRSYKYSVQPGEHNISRHEGRLLRLGMYMTVVPGVQGTDSHNPLFSWNGFRTKPGPDSSPSHCPALREQPNSVVMVMMDRPD